MSAGGLVALQARYVFPVAGEPLPRGVVAIRGERIAAVGRTPAACAPIDLGNVAILPGLVNAHTHLEFSDLATPLGEPGMAMPEWIRRVVEFRRQRAGDPRASIRKGLQEIVRRGTTLVAEIARPDWPVAEMDRCPLDAIVFVECIGLGAQRARANLDTARRHLDLRSPERRWQPAVSPHAPYTVHPELLSGLISLAAGAEAPIAFHLAESREELELLHDGRGALADLLCELGAWDPQAIAPGTRPLDYLRSLASSKRALVIHGNYLDAEERNFVAAHAQRLAVVYCPRTHAYFAHAPYPLAEMLAAGVPVALGTDSRASNPDLDMLEEMRFVARQHPGVPPWLALELGTLRGARALGCQDDCGSLQPGKYAHLTIVTLPDHEARDPHALVLDSDKPVVATISRGSLLYAAEGTPLYGKPWGGRALPSDSDQYKS